MATSAHSHPRTGFPRTIAILRALQLGDLLCAVPACRSIRSACPEARITLVGLPWASSFAERFHHYIDAFEVFPGWPGIVERRLVPAELDKFRERDRSFDLAIQLHGNGSASNGFLPELRPRISAGFFPPGQPCPDPAYFVPYPDENHEIRRLLKLIEHLGFPVKGEYLEFPLTPADRKEASSIWPDLAFGDYVCLHIGARDLKRRWPIVNFIDVARGLASRKLRVVLTGSADEGEETALLATCVGPACINLAGRTSLGGLAALLSKARLLITNDTGISHLAVAVNVPSVVIFTGSDPRRWAPLDADRHRSLGDPTSSPPATVTAETVLREADRLLAVDPLRMEVRGKGETPLPEIAWTQIKRLLMIHCGTPADLVLLARAVQAAGSVVPEATLMVLPEAAPVAHLIANTDRVLIDQDEALVDPVSEQKVRRLVDRLRSASFDAAIVFTDDSDQPYTAAYVCYLAGVPVRIAASREFGGGLLTHWIRTLPAGLDTGERSLRVLKAVGLPVQEEVEESLVALPRSIETRMVQALAELGVTEPGEFIFSDDGAETEGWRRITRQLFGRPLISPPPGSGLAERASLAKLSGLVITCDPVLARITDAFKHPLVIPNRLLDGLGCWRPRQTRSKAVSDFQPGGDALVEAVRTLLWSESYSSHNGAASVLDRERGDDAQTPWEAR